MTFRFQLLLTLFFTTSYLFAQKSSIVGNVVNNKKENLVGATIVLKGTVRAVQTNEKGEYIIKGLDKGSYKIQASFIGKKDNIIEVNLSGDQTLNINFELDDDSVFLNEVVFSSRKGIKGNEYLPEVNDYQINAAKKNELIKLDNINANLAMNNSRQIFGRVPGISVWENDGSGIQLGVASRGLSPNRSWEFNVRMNGYDITPDPMGYPEAYYTPPMEVVDRIEIIRGASSLQYGPQFGGLMNFVLRKPDISTQFTFESQNTVGSNGLLSTFNYVGGTVGRLSYTAYYQKRKGNSWRDNGYFNTNHAHFELNYAVSKKFKIGTEITYMTTKSQQPGGLTDVQFNQNARQSNRNRNWFSTPWFIPSFTAEYVFNEKTKLSWKAFSTIAERNSVGFVKAITQTDDLGKRQVDRDYYTTFGSELRLLHNYELFGLKNTLATGLRYFDGNIDRKQLGVGDAGTEMNFNLSSGAYPRDFDFSNINTAAFAENIFRINNKFLITGGVRLENISSTIEGQFNVVNGQPNSISPNTRKRSFLLFGAGSEYHLTSTTEFYTNISQAYRPVLISDLTPPATTDVIDQNLQDARGYNFDLGYRGQISNFFNFDIDYFHLNYNNRIGTITQLDDNSKPFQFRTNLGQSVSKGFEAYLEFDPVTAIFKTSTLGYLSLFASLAHINATYKNLKTTTLNNNQLVETNLAGKRVENAPRNINRFGATYNLKNLSVTWQLSSIGESFADASNTTTPNAAATSGLIPSYQVQDISGSFKFLKNYNLKAGINNLTDQRYFTRRAGGYPGPGILPADGRTAYVSLGFKF
jgi:Fe(3+) dicitrate transport protein